ncbi:hypothetical protein, partial [Kosakonia sp. PSU_31]
IFLLCCKLSSSPGVFLCVTFGRENQHLSSVLLADFQFRCFPLRGVRTPKPASFFCAVSYRLVSVVYPVWRYGIHFGLQRLSGRLKFPDARLRSVLRPLSIAQSSVRFI